MRVAARASRACCAGGATGARSRNAAAPVSDFFALSAAAPAAEGPVASLRARSSPSPPLSGGAAAPGAAAAEGSSAAARSLSTAASARSSGVVSPLLPRSPVDACWSQSASARGSRPAPAPDPAVDAGSSTSIPQAARAERNWVRDTMPADEGSRMANSDSGLHPRWVAASKTATSLSSSARIPGGGGRAKAMTSAGEQACSSFSAAPAPPSSAREALTRVVAAPRAPATTASASSWVRRHRAVSLSARRSAVGESVPSRCPPAAAAKPFSS